VRFATEMSLQIASVEATNTEIERNREKLTLVSNEKAKTEAELHRSNVENNALRQEVQQMKVLVWCVQDG